MWTEFNHHPRQMNEVGWKQLPPSRWHDKLTERYPIGSVTELYRRADDFFYRELARTHGKEKDRGVFLMQPPEQLLDLVENPLDIVACTLIDRNDNNAVIILEDHTSGIETEYSFGKSTITGQLLGLNRIDHLLKASLSLPDNEAVTGKLMFELLAQIPAIPDEAETQTRWQILTADITFLGRSEIDELAVMAICGAKEDYIWDTARSAMRYLISPQDQFLTITQIELAKKLYIDHTLWADIEKMYHIKKMIFLSPGEEEPHRLKSGSDFESQLKKNPLYLASRAKYWDLEKTQHENTVNRLLETPSKLKAIPEISYLSIGNPLDSLCLSGVAEKIEQLI